MNTATSTELAEVAATQSAVDAMAVVTLSPEKYAAEVYQPFKATLATAIDSVRAIDYDITTTAGMASAIKCRALFRDLRVSADKERKARKEPITKIGKLLESGFDQVEERITPLELMFDADIDAENARKEAEKAAKIAAERARTEAIADAIKGIREREIDLIRLTKTAAEAQAEIDNLAALDITEEVYQERLYEAQMLKASVLDAMCMVRGTRFEAEAAALAAEEARLAEAARLEAERAELARQRAEAERIANEQAIERQRLADLAAAQELAAAQLRAKAEANLQAERDAMTERMRIERQIAADAQAKAAAELKAAQDKLAADQAAHNAAIAAQQDAARRDDDHGPALEMNAEYAAAALARCTATAQAMLTNGRSITLNPAAAWPAPIVSAQADLTDLADAQDEIFPTDAELVEQIREMFDFHFNMDEAQADARMGRFDWARAVGEVAA